MSSPISSKSNTPSYGWEEVVNTDWDDVASLSNCSWSSKASNETCTADNIATLGINNLDEQEIEEKSKQKHAITNMAGRMKRKTVNHNVTEKDHNLSESEESSLEALASSSYRMSVNDRISSEFIEAVETDKNRSSTYSEKCINHMTHHGSIVFPDSKEFVPDILGGDIVVEDIADEDIWLVQCPLDLDTKQLENKEFDLTGTSELKIHTGDREKVYTATACAGRWKSLSCLLPSADKKHIEAVTMNPTGQILITEKMMHEEMNSAMSNRSNNVEFPEHLKVRHPLFGADYENELDIRRQRLLASYLQKKKKKRKKKMANENSVCSRKMKVKQTEKCTVSVSEDMEVQMDFAVTSKKDKGKKHFIKENELHTKTTGQSSDYELHTKTTGQSSDYNEYHRKKADNVRKLKKDKRSKKHLRKSLDGAYESTSIENDCYVNQEYRKKKKKKKI